MTKIKMIKRMKQIITFFLLCITMNSYSQKYKLTYFGNIHTNFCDSEGYTNGSSFSILTLNDDLILQATCLKPQTVDRVKIIYYKPKTVTSIMEYKYYLGGYETERETEIINLNLNHCDSWSGGFVSINNSLSGSSLNFTIEPIINIVPPSVDPSCSVLISSDDSGFESDIYNWEFQTLTDEWKPLPNSFQGKPNFEIALTDLFGANAYQFFNKTINFRIRYCQTKFTNIVSFTFIPCSPNVVAPIEKENISCAYKNDGILSLTFDRELIENESFAFSFFKNNALIPTPLYSVDAATNKKYTFSGLAAGNYYIKYQTFIGSQLASVNKEPYPSFTVKPATPLTFEIQNPKNPSCFGAEDGSVEIKINNGIPKFFEVDGDSVIPEELGPNLYRIKNLKAKPDGYKIKVTDANNCIDTNKYD